ncbi:MAG: DUF1553 domain-containing protein [Acidobacteria bacterium]|nr:DUF1553 domain-containing protein [Acidobacteriota bacterium]
MKLSPLLTAAAAALIGGAGMSLMVQAQEPEGELGVQHAECALFGPEGEPFRAAKREQYQQSLLTNQILPLIGAYKGRRTAAVERNAAEPTGTIDTHIFRALADNGVTPAGGTNDYEFCRRVTLDLTGRVPAAARLIAFVQDGAPDKRAKYINELLESPAWVDKWAMYFGDFLENTEFNNQVRTYPQGRNAYHKYIRDSLVANKKYDVFVTELLTATGPNSWEEGELQWFVLGFMGGGPAQDIADLQAANAAEKFLGISHENCILCHDGRRRLDGLSYWGISETRREGWELASFFNKSQMQLVRVDPANPNPYYCRVIERPANTPDYALNTTTGNRPARQPIGTVRNIAPNYPFGDGGRPRAGEPYRVALARFLTADIQFARASVNYIWKQYFGRGIVDPPNQFDLDRLDPTKPPPAPWTIQPSHPELLNALAREFQQNRFDLKWLMRAITNSQAYQMSSRYEGTWRAEYERLFARKFVRRLWGEEVVDAIAQVSNMPVVYSVTPAGTDPVPWAMQLPGTRGLGQATVPVEFRIAGIANTYANASLLDAFLRGNRIEEERRNDGSVAQVLNLLNDRYVHDRTRAAGAGATASLARLVLNKYPQSINDNLLINELFLSVLSRPATEDEIRIAQAMLNGTSGNTRMQRVEDLLWSLYNKVDFIYNY